jgi:hypothetical protein
VNHFELPGKRLSDLSLVRCFHSKLLIGPQVDVLAAFDDHRSDAEGCSDSGSDGCADRPTGDRTDPGSSSGSCTDLL